MCLCVPCVYVYVYDGVCTCACAHGCVCVHVRMACVYVPCVVCVCVCVQGECKCWKQGNLRALLAWGGSLQVPFPGSEPRVSLPGQVGEKGSQVCVLNAGRLQGTGSLNPVNLVSNPCPPLLLSLPGLVGLALGASCGQVSLLHGTAGPSGPEWVRVQRSWPSAGTERVSSLA